MPCSSVAITSVAFAADQVTRNRVDAAEGVGMNLATTVSIIVAVAAFVIWAMRDRNVIESRTTALERDRNETLKRMATAQDLADRRTRIILARIEHERTRRKIGERVIRRIAEKVGVEPQHCVDLDSDGSLAGSDSVDLLDLEGA